MKNIKLFIFTFLLIIIGSCKSDTKYISNDIKFAINGEIIPNAKKNTPPILSDTDNYLKVISSKQIFVDALTNSNSNLKNRIWHIQGLGQIKDSLTFVFIPRDTGFQKIGLCYNENDCIYKWIYVEKYINTDSLDKLSYTNETTIDSSNILTDKNKKGINKNKVKNENNKLKSSNKSTQSSKNNTKKNKPALETFSKAEQDKPVEQDKPAEESINEPVVEDDQEEVVVEKSTVKKVIAESGEDYYDCNVEDQTIGIKENERKNCTAEKKYVKSSKIIIKPKVKIKLESMIVYGTESGKFKFIISGGDDVGIKEKRLLVDKTDTNFGDLDITLLPSVVYTITIKAKKRGQIEPKFEDISSCVTKKTFSNDQLTLKYKDAIILTDLKYCY